MARRKAWMRRLWIQFHRGRLRFLRLRGDPDQIARGAALGMFLGFVLPPGTQMLVAAALAPLVRGNAIAAVAAVWVSNPVTMPLIYPLALYVGALVTGLPIRLHPAFADEGSFWWFLLSVREGSRLGFLMFPGLLVLGSIAAFVTYYLTKWLVARYRKARRPTWRSPREPLSQDVAVGDAGAEVIPHEIGVIAGPGGPAAQRGENVDTQGRA